MKVSGILLSRRALLIELLLGVDVIFFGGFNPNDSSFLVIIGCALLALTIYLLVAGLTNFFALGLPLQGATKQRLKIFLTLLIVFFILMQSIGQLSLRDALAVLPLAVVAYLYVSYNAAAKR